jgi:hypothetical protein
MLRKAGEALSPDKSVERLNLLAELLLANVAFVGTVLTGLGAFTDFGNEFSERPLLVLLPLGFGIATALVALLALVPQKVNFNPANTTQVDSIYSSRIRLKQILVWIGFGALALAIITAGAPSFANAIDDEEIAAQLSVGFNSAAGNTGPTQVIQSTAKVQNAPEGAVVLVEVTDGPAGTGDLVASRRVLVGPSGEVDLTLDSSTADDIQNPTLSVVVTKDEEELFSDQVAQE